MCFHMENSAILSLTPSLCNHKAILGLIIILARNSIENICKVYLKLSPLHGLLNMLMYKLVRCDINMFSHFGVSCKEIPL